MLKKEVFEYKDCGNIKIRLDEIMTTRNISTYELSHKANVRFQTIQNLKKESASRIDFEVLKKICYVLDCKIEDILEYIPKVKE